MIAAKLRIKCQCGGEIRCTDSRPWGRGYRIRRYCCEVRGKRRTTIEVPVDPSVDDVNIETLLGGVIAHFIRTAPAGALLGELRRRLDKLNENTNENE